MDAPANEDDLIQQFCAFTGASPAEAQTLLASHNWDVEPSVATWFASQDGGADDEAQETSSDVGMDGTAHSREVDEAPSGLVMGGGRTLAGGTAHTSRAAARTEASSSQTPTSKGKRTTQRGGLTTLKDILGDSTHAVPGHAHDDDDEDDPDYQPDFFAGGEKSGLAVQNPAGANNNRHDDQINSLLERARRYLDNPSIPEWMPVSSSTNFECRRNARPRGDDPEAPPTRFSGRGVTLGGDDAPSQVIEDPNAVQTAATPRLPRVSRVLHLWREGFSVDDGPLFRYDDPANAATLDMINQGHAPLDLLNVQPKQEVDLELDNQKDNAFVRPKQRYVPFGGSGQRLGSPTPGVASSSASTPAPPVTINSAPVASSATTSMDVDQSLPTITLQIRLGDGTRLQSRFNPTHTVGDVYGFVNAASPDSRQRAYTLMTTFPSKDLLDQGVQLGDMTEFKRGGVVVQKWK